MDISALEGQSKFQILALDGGGVRGVFTAAVLASIEEDYHVSVVDRFDLIAGTSTGGIIALALGLGLTPRDILEFYRRHGANIFGNRFGWRDIAHFFRRKYASGPLRNALVDTFGERRFGESRKRLVIPAYNLADNDVYVFRTPHLEHLRRDYRAYAWQVAMATSAAPSYFPASFDTDGLRLVDGGVWANNPSLVALVEAVGPLGIDQSKVAIFSVGTVSTNKKYSERLNKGGKFAWAADAPNLILDATSTGVVNQVRFLLGPDRFMRLNPISSDSTLTLDDFSSVDTLIAKARHASRKQAPRIAEVFLPHQASTYTPIHTHP